MSAVAEQLRQARLARNLTIQQVAEATKIRTDHIDALDAGNYTVFSAPVYIRGFVKAYARLLKLDEVQILAALDAELSHTEKFAAPPPFTARPHTVVDSLTFLLSRINWQKSLIALAAVVVLAVSAGIYMGWRHHKTTDPLAGLAPGIYQAQNSSGETLPLPPSNPRR